MELQDQEDIPVSKVLQDLLVLWAHVDRQVLMADLVPKADSVLLALKVLKDVVVRKDRWAHMDVLVQRVILALEALLIVSGLRVPKDYKDLQEDLALRAL